MNRFPWIRKYGRQESRSAFDGGTSSIAGRLSLLIGEYRTESLRWTGDPSDALWSSAWTLDAIRMQLLHGTTSADDAKQWLIAGRTILNSYQHERSMRTHPAGKARDVER